MKTKDTIGLFLFIVLIYLLLKPKVYERFTQAEAATYSFYEYVKEYSALTDKKKTSWSRLISVLYDNNQRQVTETTNLTSDFSAPEQQLLQNAAGILR